MLHDRYFRKWQDRKRSDILELILPLREKYQDTIDTNPEVAARIEVELDRLELDLRNLDETTQQDWLADQEYSA